MRRTIHDPDCCTWRVKLNGWPLSWGTTAVEADTDEDYVIVVYRDSHTDPVLPLDQLPHAQGAPWVDGTLIVVERHEGQVELEPIESCGEGTQLLHAYWQGKLDVGAGRTNWGRVHYVGRYELQDAYDRGYREGPFT